MCGISLFLDKKNKHDVSILQKMNDATKHRGPDANASQTFPFGDATLHIGNNRLKIVDISNTSNQPFFSADKRYCISFNGEIYNYKDLKINLSKKYTFHTNSDTEVVLYHLIENGIEGIQDLHGMFGILFFDTKTNTLLVIRDEHGIKPVYYHQSENYFLVSSEIKGILASTLVEKRLNDTQIPHYLQFKYAKRPETFYTSIFEIEPGTFIRLTPAAFEQKKWKLTTTDSIQRTKQELVKETEALLKKSLELQLHSDVTNGLFLSGGIDSTLLLALSNTLLEKNIPSFSIANSRADSRFGTEDYYYAKKAAAQFGSEHHEFTIDASILLQFDEFIQSIDQPIGDSAMLLSWYLSKSSAAISKVALSGAGADEWMAGYNRHWAFSKYLKTFYARPLLTKFTAATANLFPEGKSLPFRKNIRLLNKFLNGIGNTPSETFDNFKSQSLPAGFLPNLPSTSKESTIDEDWLQLALTNDRKEYLVSDVLALSDTMSMAHSQEVRVPYLDQSLTRYIETIPASMLLKYGRKWILKEILENHGGEIYTNRKKEGFGMPIGKWLFESKETSLVERFLSGDCLLRNYVPSGKIQELLKAHTSGKFDYASAIWSIIVLEAWLKKEFN